jgi:hypothetical protein
VYNLDLETIKEVIWDKGYQPEDGYAFFCVNWNANHHLGTGFFVLNGIISTVKMVQFVSDMSSYMKITGRCCDMIVLKVRAPTTDKSDDRKDSF